MYVGASTDERQARKADVKQQLTVYHIHRIGSTGGIFGGTQMPGALRKSLHAILERVNVRIITRLSSAVSRRQG